MVGSGGGETGGLAQHKEREWKFALLAAFDTMLDAIRASGSIIEGVLLQQERRLLATLNMVIPALNAKEHRKEFKNRDERRFLQLSATAILLLLSEVRKP